MTSPSDDYALLIPCATAVEAELAKDLLASHGIPVLFESMDRDFAEIGYAAHLNISRPEVFVPRAAFDKAVAILKSAWGDFEPPGYEEALEEEASEEDASMRVSPVGRAMTSHSDDYALLIPCATAVDAELAKNLLESQGIPVFFESTDRGLAEVGHAAHLNISRPEVLVPRAAFDQAVAILRETWGDFEPPGDEDASIEE